MAVQSEEKEKEKSKADSSLLGEGPALPPGSASPDRDREGDPNAYIITLLVPNEQVGR